MQRGDDRNPAQLGDEMIRGMDQPSRGPKAPLGNRKRARSEEGKECLGVEATRIRIGVGAALFASAEDIRLKRYPTGAHKRSSQLFRVACNAVERAILRATSEHRVAESRADRHLSEMLSGAWRLRWLDFDIYLMVGVLCSQTHYQGFAMRMLL